MEELNTTAFSPADASSSSTSSTIAKNFLTAISKQDTGYSFYSKIYDFVLLVLINNACIGK